MINDLSSDIQVTKPAFYERIISKISELKSEEKIAVMFSAGKDSTALATIIAMVCKNSNIKLITMQNGHLNERLLIENVINRKKKIEKLTGHNNIENIYIDVQDVFKKYGLRPFCYIKNNYKYIYLCIDCKIAMGLASALWCSKENINVLLDGYASRQWFNPEQTHEFTNTVFPIIEYFTKVKSISPLLEILQKDQELFDLLKYLGFDVFEDFGYCQSDSFGWKGQTKCSITSLGNSIYVDLTQNTSHPDYQNNIKIYYDEIRRYINEKKDIFFSNECFRDINEIIDKTVYIK